MTMSLREMERRAAEEADIKAILRLPVDGRVHLVRKYKSEVGRLAAEEQQRLSEAQQAGSTPAYSATRTLSTVMRKRLSAQRSLERIERAIAQSAPALEECIPVQKRGRSTIRRVDVL